MMSRLRTRSTAILGIALTAAVLFAAMTALVAIQPPLELDIAATEWVGARQQAWLITTMDGVRLLASQLPLLATPIVAIIIWRRRDLHSALLLAGSVAITLVGSVAIKLLIGRDRPDPYLLSIPPGETGWSYPSTSVATAVTFWGIAIALTASAAHHRRWHRPVRIAGSIAIALIGISRLYVGGHWPTDVIGGYLIGTTTVAAALYLDARPTSQNRA